jgi:biofilm PGA synthesis N-glycosyltransferase PgaC
MERDDGGSVTAILPAHNEEDCLPETIASLRKQTTPPGRIIVVSDNSTDRTVEIAKGLGVEVIETEGNTHRKAGALNCVLENQTFDGPVLIMDADTQLADVFIETALKKFKNPIVGAVGAVFNADRKDTFIRYCQYLEWMRYSNQLDRTGKVFVLSGTAAVFRPEALASVKERFGYFYDVNSMTEDSAMTIQMKSCGWRLLSPQKCRTETETMGTWKELIVQRTRWTMGAMQNISIFGVNHITLEYLIQQIMLAVSVFLMFMLTVSTVWAGMISGLHLTAFWLAIGAIFVVERIITVDGRREKFFAALMLPELFYAVVLQWAYVKALWSFSTNKTIRWHSGD